MKSQIRKYWMKKSGNFLHENNTKQQHMFLIPKYYKFGFHSSPYLRKRGGGKKHIVIDASKEELFPTRRNNVLYEEELALSDKIRSVRFAKRRKMHQIATQKHANLIFEILQEALNNGRLKKADVTWRYLEFAPKFVSDDELDNYVQIDLIDVGFEIIGVTMPNHRQFCVIWWKYNNLCKLDGGLKLIEKVLDLYRNTLRAIIARKMVLKITPRLVFRMINDNDVNDNNENILYHKEKMDYLVENALIEEYQKYLGIDFKSEDNENDRKYKNESFHDVLMNKIYGDWRYDENGNLLKAFNIKKQRKEINDKWIDTFLNKVNIQNKPTQIERDIIKNKRKEKYGQKHKEKAEILNRILSTDPNYIANHQHQHQHRKRKDILISSKQQNHILISSKPRLIDKKTQSQPTNIMLHDPNDLDLIGFVE